MNRHTAFVILLGLLALAGCRRQPQVREYRTPPPPASRLEANKEGTQSDSPSTTTEKIGTEPKNTTPTLKKITPREPKVLATIKAPVNTTGEAKQEYFRESYLNHDGTILLTSSEQSVRAWDVASGSQLFEAKTKDRWEAQYFASPSGKVIAKIDIKNSKVELLKATTGSVLSSYPIKGQIRSFTGHILASFSPSGDRFLFVNRLPTEGNRIFAVHELDCETGTGRKLTFQELSNTNDNENLESIIPLAQPDMFIVTLRTTKDHRKYAQARLLWSAGENKLNHVNWVVDDSVWIHSHIPLSRQIAFSPDRRFLCSYREEGITLTIVATNEKLFSLEGESYRHYITPTFTPDGQRLILNKAWDRKYFEVGAVGDAAYKPDKLQLINLKDGTVLSEITHKEFGWGESNDLAYQLSISGDGKKLAFTRYGTSQVQIIDFESCFGVAPLAPR